MNKNIPCLICNVDLATQKKFDAHCLTNKHLKKVNGGVVEEIECKTCNVKFASESALTIHLNTKKHLELVKTDGVKIDKCCNVCDLKFLSQTSYAIHCDTKKHQSNILFADTGINKMNCLYCDYFSDNSSNLSRHIDNIHPTYPKIKDGLLNGKVLDEIYSILKKQQRYCYSRLIFLKKKYEESASAKNERRYNEFKNKYSGAFAIIKKLEDRFNLSNKNIVAVKKIEIEEDEEEDEEDEDDARDEEEEEDEYIDELKEEVIKTRKKIDTKRVELLNLQNGFDEMKVKFENDNNGIFPYLKNEIESLKIEIKLLEGLIV